MIKIKQVFTATNGTMKIQILKALTFLILSILSGIISFYFFFLLFFFLSPFFFGLYASLDIPLLPQIIIFIDLFVGYSIVNLTYQIYLWEIHLKLS